MNGKNGRATVQHFLLTSTQVHDDGEVRHQAEKDDDHAGRHAPTRGANAWPPPPAGVPRERHGETHLPQMQG